MHVYATATSYHLLGHAEYSRLKQQLPPVDTSNLPPSLHAVDSDFTTIDCYHAKYCVSMYVYTCTYLYYYHLYAAVNLV